MAQEAFDLFAVLHALDQRRVKYIVVGALGRVIQGSDEVTDGIDIVPAMVDENLQRLGLVLDDLNARRRDRARLDLEQNLADGPVLELRTEAGEVKIVAEPAGTRGYDDLRRDASREPLGKGLRPSVASMGDHARMLAALNREQDLETLRRVRRLIELDRARSRGWSLER